TLTVHVADPAHDLGLSPPERLYTPELLEAKLNDITGKLDQGLFLRSGGHPLVFQWTGADPLPAQSQIRSSYRIPNVTAAAASVRTDLYTYDRFHQTFVNIYLDGKLRQQWIFNHGSAERTYYFGTTAGVLEVIKTFVPAGIHHILIGPDHILF